MIVTVRNPYFDKTYKVKEKRGDIEQAIHNIECGNESFIKLHDEDGTTVLINPANFASVEVSE